MIPAPLSPFANHLWQSTVFAGAALLLMLMLKRNRAHIRYRLWLAASVKFLVPFSLLLTIGSQFEWRTAPAVAPPLSSAIEQISQPFTPQIHSVATAPTTWPWLPALVALVWLCGSAAVIFRWRSRWRRVRKAMRTASRLPIQAPVDVMSSASRLEPGIFGVFRPVLLLPEGIADRLTPAQFQAILAHEFCHVRRRDNLAAAIHMVVEAVFWFHPIVWWIGARLIEERELACDEEVLRQGSQPEVYAAGILNVCKFYLETGLACASGVTGADLKKRVEAIMTARILHSLTLARKLLLAAAGIAALAIPIVIGIVNAPQIRAQAQDAAPLKFEVATIKPSKNGGGKGGLEILPGGGLRMGGVTLRNLITFAYDIPENRVTGGPRWLGSEAYDIVAKAERVDQADDRPATVVAPGTAAWDRVRQRTQALLAERFALVIHRDVKEGPAYALVVTKNGPKLKESQDQGNPRTMRSFGRIEAQRGTMHMLSALLTNWLGRPVLDRTGLTGTYDYKVEYGQDHAPVGSAVPSEVPTDANFSGPSIFVALQEQLGLKLESIRAAVETIVIDRAERPSAN
jgi:bla regulator protein blaR1